MIGKIKIKPYGENNIIIGIKDGVIPDQTGRVIISPKEAKLIISQLEDLTRHMKV